VFSSIIYVMLTYELDSLTFTGKCALCVLCSPLVGVAGQEHLYF